MNNRISKVIVILMVVGFAATSFAVMSNYGAHNPSVGRRADNIVKPMSSNSVIDTIPVGSEPDAVAFDSLNGYMYVANCQSGNVSVINSENQIVDSIKVGQWPKAVAFDAVN
jgi:YVTN family beta-propeller protein